MPRLDTELNVTPSILDRLIDNEPLLAADPPETRLQSVRKLKAALRRDLEWLLNTRRIPDEIPESLQEVYRSVYNYGLPDFSHVSLSSPRDRNRLLRGLESAIGIFEPRLVDVKVMLVDQGSATSRMMRFQIDGLLKMDPAPEQVSFDTVLELSTGDYQVKGESG
jgi:type VI secretion system protein ImpF